MLRNHDDLADFENGRLGTKNHYLNLAREGTTARHQHSFQSCAPNLYIGP